MVIDPITDRNRAAEYCLMRRLLRPGSIFSIIFGCIAIALGGLAMADSPAGAWLLLIGVVLFVQGIWILRAPSPTLLLVESGVFALLAVSNVYSLMIEPDKFENNAHWFVIVALQVWWSYDFYKKYQRFAPLKAYEPVLPLCQELTACVNRVMRGNPAKDAAVVVLTTFKGKWKIGLLGDELLMMPTTGADLLIATRGDVRISSEGKVAMSKDVKVTLGVRGREWKGQMSPQQLERVELWLSTAPEPEKVF